MQVTRLDGSYKLFAEREQLVKRIIRNVVMKRLGWVHDLQRVAPLTPLLPQACRRQLIASASPA